MKVFNKKTGKEFDITQLGYEILKAGPDAGIYEAIISKQAVVDSVERVERVTKKIADDVFGLKPSTHTEQSDSSNIDSTEDKSDQSRANELNEINAILGKKKKGE